METSMATAFTIYLLSVQNLRLASSQEMCGSVGNSNEERLDQAATSSSHTFYLNTANPAPCSGTVSKWRVCYYGPPDETILTSYWATYAVYRRDSASDTYNRVSDTFSAVQASGSFLLVFGDGIDGLVQVNNFTCYNDSIDASLTVQAGDVIGACVFDPEDVNTLVTRLQLNVVGRSGSANSQLMQMDVTGCTVDALPPSVSTASLTLTNSTALHIYAMIDSIETATSDMEMLPTTSSSTEEPFTPTRNQSWTTEEADGPTVVSWTTSSQSTHFTGEQGHQQDNENNMAGPIVGGAIISVIVLISLLVVVICTAVCYRLKKMKEEKDNGAFSMDSNVAYRKRSGEDQGSITVIEEDYVAPIDCNTNADFSQRAVSDYYESIKEDMCEGHPSKADGDFTSVENIAYKAMESSGYTTIDGEAHQDVDEYDYVNGI